MGWFIFSETFRHQVTNISPIDNETFKDLLHKDQQYHQHPKNTPQLDPISKTNMTSVSQGNLQPNFKAKENYLSFEAKCWVPINTNIKVPILQILHHCV